MGAAHVRRAEGVARDGAAPIGLQRLHACLGADPAIRVIGWLSLRMTKRKGTGGVDDCVRSTRPDGSRDRCRVAEVAFHDGHLRPQLRRNLVGIADEGGDSPALQERALDHQLPRPTGCTVNQKSAAVGCRHGRHLNISSNNSHAVGCVLGYHQRPTRPRRPVWHSRDAQVSGPPAPSPRKHFQCRRNPSRVREASAMMSVISPAPRSCVTVVFDPGAYSTRAWSSWSTALRTGRCNSGDVTKRSRDGFSRRRSRGRRTKLIRHAAMVLSCHPR